MSRSKKASLQNDYKYVKNPIGFFLTIFAIFSAAAGVVVSSYYLVSIKKYQYWLVNTLCCLICGCIFQIIFGIASFYPFFYETENIALMLAYAIVVPVLFIWAGALALAEYTRGYQSRDNPLAPVYLLFMSFFYPYYKLLVEEKCIFRPIHRIRNTDSDK